MVGGEELGKQLSFVIVTSMQFLPLATFLAMPTYGGLWSQRTRLMGGHDFLDYLSFRMTCIMIAFVLVEVMLCCRKSLM